MKIITGIISVSLLGCLSALGYTLNQSAKTVTTDGSSSDVQSAISAASDGWTVLVPSGSFSWSGISISGKGIWLRGAGAASTTVSGSININKDSTHAVEVSGIKFASGNPKIRVSGSWSAKPVIVHDCTFNENGSASFLFDVNGGLIYNCTFTGSGGYNDQAVKVKMDSNVENQWTSADTLGSRDSNGDKNVYIEDCTFTKMPLQAFDFDGCSRMVVRNCTFTDSAITSHGADTSPIGMRQYEIYNNRFIFNNYGDCDGSRTPNLDYFMYIRGGTGCIYSNTVDDLSSCAWGNKSEVKLTVYNITRRGGQVPCQTSYPAYQQIGQGHNGSSYFTDPLYVWGNSSVADVGLSQYSPDECGNGQQIGNYIKPNRDYFLSAKPGYTRYAYPHPLRSGIVAQNPASIAAGPQNLTLNVGQSATFSVTASGDTPLSYQWQKNLVNISGATSSSYAISSVQLSEAGSFRCVVSNPYGSATSAAATLTVNVAVPVPASITASPQNLTLNVGQTATFSVTASGDAPLWYQWQKNLVNISGATSSSYAISSVQLSDAGSLRCVVSNPYGSANSAAATLTVKVAVPVPASITASPQSLTRTVGQSATFTVTASGDAPLSYQWQKNLVNISGATSSSYVISSVQSSDAGSFRCVLSNPYGSATSAAATLTVNVAGAGNLRYVDQTAGNDGNVGTVASPWRRCPGMVGWTGSATLQPGDTLYFDRSDTWDIGQNSGGPGLDLKAGVHYIGDEWDPETVGSGRAILRATGRHEAGVVRIWEDHATLPTWLEGFEVNANGQRANLIDINHAFWKTGLTKAVKRIEDCVAHDNDGNGSQGDYKYGIIVSDNSPDASGWVANVEILNTVIYNIPRDGFCLYPGDSGMISNVVVRGCEVYNTGNDPSYSEGHGLMLKGNVKNSVFEYSYAHDVNSSAVFINGPENGSGTGPTGCAVRYCVLQTADNNGVIRFYGPGTKGCNIYGNIVLENEATGGLSFSGNAGTITANIYNNTFFDAFVDLGNPSGSGTINFRNNIIYEMDDVCLTDSGGDLDTHSHNLFYRANGGTLVSAGGTYNAGNIGSWESTAQTANPLFKNASNLPTGHSGSYGSNLAPNADGLSLQAGSPALNVGTDLGGAYNGSINSTARPVGSAWDIGAYEGSSTGQPAQPAPPAGLRVIGG